MAERPTAKIDAPCHVCGRLIKAYRSPAPGRVFSHGSCLGRPVLIVEYDPNDGYIVLPP